METVTAREAVKRWDTWALLGAPYLDTEHEAEWSRAYADELRSRRIVGVRGVLFRLVALGGFWWNFVLWWEWASLDRKHLEWGWVLNGILAVSLAVGSVTHWAIGIVTFIALQWVAWPIVRRRWEK